MHAACMLLVCIIASTAHSPLTEWDSMGPCASPLEVVKLVQPFQCRFRKYAPIGSVMMSLWSYRPPQSRSKREGKARIRKASSRYELASRISPSALLTDGMAPRCFLQKTLGLKQRLFHSHQIRQWWRASDWSRLYTPGRADHSVPVEAARAR